MSHSLFLRGVAVGAAVWALLAWPAAGAAQTVNGFAAAADGKVAGVPAALGHTGTLADENDARAVSMPDGGASTLTGQVIEAATISSIQGWDSLDFVSSGASLADVSLSLAGLGVAAGFLGADAVAPVGGSPSGTSTITGLAVNGVPVYVSGAPNQRVYFPGFTLTLNEVRKTTSSVTVSALRVASWDGLTNLAIATATAGVGTSSFSSPLGLR
ncbi:MAG: hypothetical protein HY317_04990 [Acidobacteria bacterium]|nr:hypothetical protein [Acidobacteriota bacterium]